MGKLTKPTKPQGVNKGTSARRGRLPGFAPAYTPEQTQRYKSQALRYSKAVELSAGGPDHIEWNGQILSGDDAANLRDAGGRAFKLTDRVGFYYQSARSKVDYWTVRYGGGGLEELESFSDAITTTGTVACPEPVVTWSWESPAFDWSAQTIKVCEQSGGGGSEPDGALSYTFPPAFDGNYSPVPSGQTRFLTITGTMITTPGMSAPYVQSFSRWFDATDVLSTVLTGTFVSLFLNGYAVYAFPVNGFADFSSPGYPFVQVYVWNVVVTGNGPLLAPPPYTPPQLPLPTFPPGTDSPFPPLPPTKATAGGTFTSNTFTASSTSTVQVQLDYTTVPDIGVITGAIAVQLWSDAGVMLAELMETPSNGGAGTLEATFDLTEGEAYYVVIVIPETCYCDAATVAIGGAGFVCDCPDYTKVQKPSLNSVYNSEQVDRDWADSEAGCDQEQGCKHKIATLIFLGLPVEAPTDYPLT